MSVYILHGLRPWLLQRITAVYVAAYAAYALIVVFTAAEYSHAAWREWLFAPFNSIATGLLVPALLLHAWIGMRDIILDYSHSAIVRTILLSLVVVVLAGSGLWAFKILLLAVAA